MKNENQIIKEMNEVVNLYDYYLASYVDKNDYQICSINEEKIKNNAAKYIARVFKTFLSMKEEEKELLNNEFFNRKRSGWWIKRYSKDEYEDLFFKTIFIFLRRFKEYAY